jgi:hypothetical protein
MPTILLLAPSWGREVPRRPKAPTQVRNMENVARYERAREWNDYKVVSSGIGQLRAMRRAAFVRVADDVGDAAVLLDCPWWREAAFGHEGDYAPARGTLWHSRTPRAAAKENYDTPQGSRGGGSGAQIQGTSSLITRPCSSHLLAASGSNVRMIRVPLELPTSMNIVTPDAPGRYS